MLNFIKNKTPIIICDIGASPIDKTDFIENLYENTFSKLIGFEPNPDAYEQLDKTDKNKIFYNFAIGDGYKKILNICRAPGMSSFLEPNLNYLSKFHNFDRYAEIIKKIKVQTKKLSSLGQEIDFLKIDVQGYESEIISHNIDEIQKVKVLQIETSPTPLYKNEKSFSKILSRLEDLGFSLHMFNNINTRTFKPLIIEKNIYKGLHHLFQLDCVLIKNFSEIEKLKKEDLIKLILILFYSFNSIDLVDFLITLCDKKFNTNFLKEFRNLGQRIKITRKY